MPGRSDLGLHLYATEKGYDGMQFLVPEHNSETMQGGSKMLKKINNADRDEYYVLRHQPNIVELEKKQEQLLNKNKQLYSQFLGRSVQNMEKTTTLSPQYYPEKIIPDNAGRYNFSYSFLYLTASAQLKQIQQFLMS